MVVFYFKSKSTELFSHATEVQDSLYQAGRISDQVRGLGCHDRSKICILPLLHSSPSQGFPEFCLGVKLTNSSFRPCTLTPHFHELCCFGSAATPGYPHTELYQ